MPTINAIGTPQITLGGTFTMSGAYTFIGRLTGNTDVTFPTSGTLATTSGSVPGIIGTANQVLANGTSGVAISGTNVTLTTPQDIATTSSPTFAALTLTSPLTVANGGSGLATLTAYTLLAGGTTATGVMQQVLAGSAGQLLQSNGASALPTWTTATFPSGSGTLNHMLRSDGTNWVETTATTLDASDNFAGITSAGIGNLSLSGSTISTVSANSDMILLPNGTGNVLAFTSTAFNSVYATSLQSLRPIAVARYNAGSGTNSGYFMGFTSRAAAPGSFSASLNGDPMARLVAYGDDGSAFQEAGLFQFNVVSTAPGVVSGRALLYTSNASGVRSLGMEITNTQIANFSQSVNAVLGISSGAATGGTAGAFLAYAPTSALGSTSLVAADNAGNFANVLTNASTAAARTWTLPDESGTVALTSGLAGYATQVQVQQSAFNVGLDTGVADAYIVNLTPAVASLTDGLMVAFTANNPNATTTPTLTVNGNTAPIVTWVGLNVSANDVGQGGTSFLMYSSGLSAWMLLNGTVSDVSVSGIQNAWYYGATDAGAANAYVVTLNQGVGVGLFSPDYGSQVYFIPDNSNTTASTLVVNGQGPTAIIMMDGSTLPAGALLTTKTAWVVFGQNAAGTLGWILMNPQSGLSKVTLGTQNQLAWYAATGTTVSGLATANNGLLVTSAGGVPSIANTLGAGFTFGGTVITTVGNFQSNNGGFIAGNGSFQANLGNAFVGISAGASLGSLSMYCSNNGGNYANVLTNLSTSAARTWSLPDASGTIALTSGASGIVNSGLINQLAYYAAAGTTVSGLATAANGVLITSAGSAPSISSTLPSAVQTNITQLGTIAQNITFTAASSPSYRVLFLNGDTDSGFAFQAGAGTAAGGGGLTMFGQNHATKPGWVTAGLSSGAGASFFTVNNQGWLGAGTDVFTVSETGAVVANQGINAKAGAIISGLAAGGFVGNVACYSTTANRGYIEMLANNNATGNFGSTIRNSTAQAQNQTLTIPDVGAATANFIMSSGTQSIGAGLTLTTPNIGAATATSINFGGSTLSTYTANGTWTPVFTFETPGDLGVSYSTQVGTYSRIGNIVTISALMVFTPTFTTSASSAQITGIPFTASSVAGSAFPGVLWRTGFAAPATVLKDFVYMGQSYTFLYMYGNTATGTTTPNFDVTQFTTGVACTIRFVITYFV